MPRLEHIDQLSNGTKQLFNEIRWVYLCLGGALHLIKSVKSVCGLIVATITRNDRNGLFVRYKLYLCYCLHQEIQKYWKRLSGNKTMAWAECPHSDPCHV